MVDLGVLDVLEVDANLEIDDDFSTTGQTFSLGFGPLFATAMHTFSVAVAGVVFLFEEVSATLEVVR